jgi:phosphoglucosamine mutase
MMVDSDGTLLDGDDILYIIARSRQGQGGLNGSVVGTVMSNLGLEHALGDLGIGFERTNVGDRYIMEQLRANGWVLGGEPSGHIICLDRTTTGDGIVSALQVMAELLTSGQDLKSLRKGVEKYPQILQNIDLGGNSPSEIMASNILSAAVREVEAELGDSGRVLLRPSGTEPLIRVMIEGRHSTQVETLTRQLAHVVESLVA